MKRWWYAVVAVCCAVVALGPAATARAQTPTSSAAAGPVVLLGVPDLRWQDVTATGTPALWRLAGRSAIGAMTDQSGEGDARRATGWLTLGTGSRAVAFAPALTVPDVEDAAQLERLVALNRAARFHSKVGALGDALHGAGLTVGAVYGSGAVLGGMTSAGRVDVRASSVSAALQSGADVVAVELPQLYDVDRTDPSAVQAALATVDAAVATVVGQVPPGATLLVAGVSDGSSGRAHLHVAMAEGPSFAPGRLTSASTGRPGVVQLIDVAPTVLSVLHVTAPSALIGEQWQRVAEAGTSARAQVASFVDLDERSVAQVVSQSGYFRGVCLVALVYSAWTVLGWRRRSGGVPLVVSASVAAVPAASWLIQLAPWWRIGTWSLLPLSVVFALAIGIAAVLSPWPRSSRWRPAAVVGGVTMLVLVLDAATGSPLSLDAPFGDNPIIAGRFHGIGNVALALLGTGTLLLAAAVAAGRTGLRAAAGVVGLGLVAVVVDGYPGLGDDFGGVLALLPALCVLGLVVSGVRLSWRWIAAVLGATLVTVTVFALVDYARPASQRTHLGRFVQQLADGSAWPVINRKLDSSLATFTGGWPRYVALIWLVLTVLVVVGVRTGRVRLRDGVGGRTVGGLVAALAVLGVLGAALNDSGLAITAFVLYVGVPALLPLFEPEGPSPHARPASTAATAQDLLTTG